MTIPLVAFLYLYLLFVFAWLIFSLIAFYHIMKYGQICFASFIAVSAYFVVSVIILTFSYEYLSQIDWSIGLTVFQGGSQFFGANNL
ncbi:MAG: hypothetical protein Q7K35_05250 [bacterium]|nr:hypothetical protein [bacterium]